MLHRHLCLVRSQRTCLHFISVPFFNDQDQFGGLDDNESAAAAAGAAAAAALAAADRESNYRKASQVVKDPYFSK